MCVNRDTYAPHTFSEIRVPMISAVNALGLLILFPHPFFNYGSPLDLQSVRPALYIRVQVIHPFLSWSAYKLYKPIFATLNALSIRQTCPAQSDFSISIFFPFSAMRVFERSVVVWILSNTITFKKLHSIVLCQTLSLD